MAAPGTTTRLDDGRLLSWAEYGDPSGAPLVMLHGTPGSRLQFRYLNEPASAAGIRLVAPERPGYGRSDPVPGGTSFAGYAGDVGHLLDVLGLATATLAGVSGGGGFAVATALAVPHRVRRLLLLSAGVPAPRPARRGMSPAVRILLFLAWRAPGLAARLLAAQLTADLDSAPARWGRRLMPADDRRLLDDPLWRARFEEDLRESLRQGTGAAVRDLALARFGPGAPDVAGLAVDTVLVHGTADVNVPIGLARWIAARLPSARLIELPGAGHLSVLEQVVLDLVEP